MFKMFFRSRAYERSYSGLSLVCLCICSICVRFRNGIKDLEVMMQNLIVSAFETVSTVEQGVEVLDIFMHLSSREVKLTSSSQLFSDPSSFLLVSTF